MEFELRSKIDGQYVVTAKHYGGMSVVYIVLDEFSQRRFAVKTLKEELLVDRGATRRFAAEARTWMNLGRHPNIVEAIIYREIEGQPFLFLEYVEGSNLQNLIDAEGRLFPPQVVEFMGQVAAGMAYVHNAKVGPGDHGVVHRDLKPANMMLDLKATVKITDFGLAKPQGMPSTEMDVGIGLGTYLYMPPEQLLDASSADRTSDIYSYGVSFYNALTGRPPIQGRTVNHVVRAIMAQVPPLPSTLVAGVPGPLEQILMRCLAKRREERYQSFEEILAELERVGPRVRDAFAGEARARQCQGCGYLTLFEHTACPICAHPVKQTGFPPPASEAVATTVVPTAAAPAEAGPTPEEAAVAELMEAANGWRQRNDLNRAANLLRQALTIVPGHVEARRLLDETVLQLARQRPRTAQKAYNWPMFRGNVARTGQTPEVVAPPLQRRWQHKLGDWVLASPIVSNGIVFAGGRLDRPALQGHFEAMHAANGQTIWEFDTSHEILLTPCVLAGTTIFLASLNRLYALDTRTGHRLWDIGTDAPITAAPVAVKNAIYFGTEDGTLCAVSAQNGQRLWGFRTEMGVYSSPLVWERAIYFGSNDHRLYALDLDRGRLLWEFMAAGEITSTPAFHQGRVLVGARDNRLYCLDSGSGRRIWEFATAGACNSSPAIWQDLAYIGSRDKSLYAVEIQSGQRRWHFAAGDWVESSAAVSGRTLYFGCHNGKVFGVEAETGILLWEYETGGEVASSPAVSSGRVFVGSNDGCVYAFSGLS